MCCDGDLKIAPVGGQHGAPLWWCRAWATSFGCRDRKPRVGLPHWAHVGHSTGPGAMSSSDARTRSSSTSSGAMTRVPNDIGVATSCTAIPAQPRSPGRNHPHPIHRADPRSESDHTAPGGKTPLSDQHESRLSRTAVFWGGHPGLWRRRHGRSSSRIIGCYECNIWVWRMNRAVGWLSVRRLPVRLARFGCRYGANCARLAHCTCSSRSACCPRAKTWYGRFGG